MISRRQSCRGKSQAPRSLDSRVAGNQDSEAYRQDLPWGEYELPGRNNVIGTCMALLIWAEFGFMGAFPRYNVVTTPSLRRSLVAPHPATS